MAELDVSPPEILKNPIHVPQKLLMGPGPSNVSQRVLNAQALPTLGHLHTEFCKIMDECKEGIRYAFQTKNPFTLSLSSTGHAGMEAVMANILERGEVVLIAENGIWGQRASDMASRQGADVRMLSKPAGEPFTLDEIGSAIEEHKPVMFFITHGESSTGCKQNLEDIGPLCASHNCLYAVDTVASLGGAPVYADRWGIDVIYTGSQKVLGVPPGLAPISFSRKAIDKIKNRKTPVSSFCWDMTMLGKYWDCFEDNQPRFYHHTGPVNQIYALREGLALLAEEGLDSCIERHQRCALKLHKGLEEMGLELFVRQPEARLPTVTTIKVPEGVDWKAVTVYAMQNHMIEIAGGLGPTAGKVWRIGLMGINATEENVDLVLKVLKEAIQHSKI